MFVVVVFFVCVVFFLFFLCFFFFQAEDGIRGLVRSRGLGDEYKKQGVGAVEQARTFAGSSVVSSTHLTLPTKRIG